jgi:LmbE family N-acetylglucosaminyl deacetylase
LARSIFEFKQGLRVLALSPHADDIELGCGATLLYLQRYCGAEVNYRLFCRYVLETTRKDGVETETRIPREAEAKAASQMLGCENFLAYKYHDRMFPRDQEDIQRTLKELRYSYNPDLIFAPRLDDNHQDHAAVGEAAIRVFRDGQAIWHYEIKQFGQNEFDANIFVNVSGPSRCEDTWKDVPGLSDKITAFHAFRRGDDKKDTLAHLKIFVLQECMISQRGKTFLDPELLLGTMKLRGAQCGKGIKYAEAFYAKTVVNLYNQAEADSRTTELYLAQGGEANEESTE